MIDPRDIHSLTDFQRNTRQHLKRLKKSGQPAVLTVNGRASVIVQDAESYHRMIAELESQSSLASIQRGITQMERGEGRPMDDVFNDLERRLTSRAAGAPRRRKAS